jgi:hypothetical protein
MGGRLFAGVFKDVRLSGMKRRVGRLAPDSGKGKAAIC